MKICFVSPSVGTIVGGSETIIQQFARQLSEKHEVILLTGKSRHMPLQKNIVDAPYKVLTVPFWPRFTPKNNFATRIIRRLDPYKAESLSFYYNVMLRPKIKESLKEMDVISTHYRLDSRLFSNLAFKLGVPSVFHILGGSYSKDFFEKDKSALYVATSPLTQNLINSKHGTKIRHFVTPGIPSWVLTKKIEKKDHERRLLFVGRLQRSKGIFELVEMFKKLSQFDDKMTLTIVGIGNILNELRDQVDKFGLKKRIIFPGSVPYEKVFDHYFNSSLFVFPSKKETFGMVPLEAMACGLPVIASDIPSIREATGGCAILVSLDNIDEWVDRIKTLISDENTMKDMSAKGRVWAQQFTWEKKAEEYERCLLEAIEKF
ncbi:MAG: glycosyltransferase family 4 protein [Methanomassiliicoccales archaeon]|nr:MAG: glycosyltransferase family 4 protein [Methanomassiliicoccales archaeon]